MLKLLEVEILASLNYSEIIRFTRMIFRDFVSEADWYDGKWIFKLNLCDSKFYPVNVPWNQFEELRRRLEEYLEVNKHTSKKRKI